MDLTQIAIEYIARGWKPIPIPRNAKAPNIKNWPSVEATVSTVKDLFDGYANIGIILGARSGIADVDLDSPEAVRLASKFLPSTGLIFGRASKPQSHFLIALSDEIETYKYIDPIDRSVLLEIRADKCQTVFPPSVHPSGEAVQWSSSSHAQPASVPRQAINLLAAVSLLVRHWPTEGSRHDAHLHLIGALASAGMSRDLIDHIAYSICYATDDPEYAMRANLIDRAIDRAIGGDKLTGWNQLAAVLQRDGAAIVKRVRNWIGAEKESGKPKIYTHDPTTEAVNISVEALRDRNVYQRSRALVRIVHEPSEVGGVIRPVGSPSISLLSADTLREELEQVISFVKVSKEGDESIIKPSKDLVNTILARSEWDHIKPLIGIVNHQIMRADGSIASAEGYDRSTRVILSNLPKMPDALPTIDQALRLIVELVADFPFESSVDLSAWISATLTNFARYSFEGPTPLIVVDGNTRGVGKSLLADLTSLILYGRIASRREMPNNPEEWGKSLLGIAIAGDPMILLDNVKHKVNSSYFEAILTGSEIQQRVLGRNEELRLPLRTQFWITSNNATLSADLIRRSIRIRLATPYEHPESLPAAHFRHPDIRAHVKQNRALYVAAFLALLRARPVALSRTMGSFEAWSGSVRARLVAIGLPDPVETQNDLAALADDESSNLGGMLQAWYAIFGDRWISISELAQIIVGPDAHQLRSAVTDYCGLPPGERISNIKISRGIRESRDRVVGGYVLRTQTDKRTNATLWRVERKDD